MKYEYTIVKWATTGWTWGSGSVDTEKLLTTLHDMANHNWELISSLPLNDRYGTEEVLFIFKRPQQQ